MAKTAKAKATAPNCLEVSLFNPEMDLLLRAGIGGLATTLRWIERSIQGGRYDEDEIPESWINDGVPWEVKSDKIVFRFAEPEKVNDVFKPIFQIAFGLNPIYF